jgi:tRNA 2-thiouridine synthesizing protein E
VCGYELDEHGYLLDSQKWTESYASQMAALLGISELKEGHWKVLRYARARYAETGSSPNIRAITAGMGISTKELYTLWPVAPGTTTARISGLPKPVGCI